MPKSPKNAKASTGVSVEFNHTVDEQNPVTSMEPEHDGF